MVVVGALGLWADECLVSRHFEVRVHRLSFGASCGRFRLAYVRWAEQELAIEVGHLDAVVVCDSDRAVRTARDAHQGKSFGVFAAESAGSDHESLHIAQLFLDLSPIDPNLVVIAAIKGLPVDVFGWK